MPDRVFPDVPFKSHMPFLADGLLLFCRAEELREFRPARGGEIWRVLANNPSLRPRFEGLSNYSSVRYRAWKLAFCLWPDRTVRSIPTGLPPGAVECSPAHHQEDGTHVVSFLGGIPGDSAFEYFLYEMRGPSLEQLGAPKKVFERQARLGFVSPHHICVGIGNTVRLIDRDGGEFSLALPFVHTYRASFVSGSPEQLLFSGQDADDRFRTLVYDCQSGCTRELCAGQPVYKASLYDGRVVFAQRGDTDFEDRYLRHALADVVEVDLACRRL